MIRCHLARMIGEHKMHIADVARETGVKPRNSHVTVQRNCPESRFGCD